jgi:hypothetical protein
MISRYKAFLTSRFKYDDATFSCFDMVVVLSFYYYYYRCSALGSVWAKTRAQSGDWYGSGTLHPRQILRGSLPFLCCH